jgi:hypothetical protein
VLGGIEPGRRVWYGHLDPKTSNLMPAGVRQDQREPKLAFPEKPETVMQTPHRLVRADINFFVLWWAARHRVASLIAEAVRKRNPRRERILFAKAAEMVRLQTVGEHIHEGAL